MNSSLRNKLSALVQRRLKVERRGVKRIAPTQRTLALLKDGQDGETITAHVHDLSSKGLAVYAGRDYPLGTLLHVILVNAAHTFSVAVEVKIVRVIRESGNGYLLAGPFNRTLAHDEVIPFIL